MGKLSEKARRDWIRRRPKESLFWAVVHLFGSLRLAMFLLFTILVAIATATIYESKFDAAVAQHYIYHAPWFIFWLTLLCVNLVAAVMTRWPWQRKHAGFAITHLGIITLLIGAVVGSKFGFEGSVTLHKGAPPVNRVLLDRKIVEVSDAKGISWTMPMPVAVHPPTKNKPKIFAIPESALRLVVDDYSQQLALQTKLLPVAKNANASEGAAGVQLLLSSKMMDQRVPITLIRESHSANRNDFFGRAQLVLLKTLPDRSASKLPMQKVDERQIIFLRNAQQPVISAEGAKSGWQFELQFTKSSTGANGTSQTSGEPMLIAKSPDEKNGKTQKFSLTTILGKPQSLNETSGGNLKITVSEYWPDFAIRNKKPVSLSNQPRNPAALLTISGEIPKASQTVSKNAQPLFEMAVSDGKLVYQLSRNDVIYAHGSAKQGESIPLQWADWHAQIVHCFQKAKTEKTVMPAASGVAMENRQSGIRVHLSDASGKKIAPIWIPTGRSKIMRLDGQARSVAFGLATQRLGFDVQLMEFKVPREEGSSEPSDFISLLRFRNLQDGKMEVAESRMNHPAAFPAGLWRSALGMNYKFSQVGWDPSDTNQTSLQILHDPGWPLKWIGSLLICGGIAIMFYFTPKRSKPLNANEMDVVNSEKDSTDDDSERNAVKEKDRG